MKGDRVLLVRRGHAPLKGEWSIPGGALELGESLEDAIRREVLEETGLKVKVLRLVEVVDRVVFGYPDEAFSGTETVAKRVQYHYVLVDYLCVPTDGCLACGSDASEARWVEPAELRQYCVAPITISVVEKAIEMFNASKMNSGLDREG